MNVFTTCTLIVSEQLILPNKRFTTTNIKYTRILNLVLSLIDYLSELLNNHSCPQSINMQTVMCLSIGTPKAINFPFVPNVKLILFRCPKFWAQYSLIIMFSNIETPKKSIFHLGQMENWWL